ncbi:Ethylene-responsive transcription factor CRF1 [Hordeum vulgare]|nr:Ethylene-responsive transcription factor CRF1 [Hordeum vulgare]
MSDAAAWSLNRPRREMNSSEVMMMEWAQNVAPRPRVVTDEDRSRNRRQQHRLCIAEMDEHAMGEWRQLFPHDVLDECQFFAQRRAGRGRNKPPIVKIHGRKPHSSRWS